MDRFDRFTAADKFQIFVYCIILLFGLGSITYYFHCVFLQLFGDFISYIADMIVTFGLVAVIINVSKMDLR